MKNLIKKLLIVMVLLLIIPYFIPLPKIAEYKEKPFENSYFQNIDGVRLHYRVWTPSKPKGKVLMVHGLAGSTFSFQNNIEALYTQGYQIVAVDLPGFGYSDRKKGVDHSQENRAQLLWLLLNSIDEEYAYPGKWTLIGHSMGGGTITAMALMKRENTNSLIYIDGAILNHETSRKQLLSIPPLRRWFEVIARHYILKEKRLKGFLESAYGRTVTTEELSGYFDPLSLPGTEQAFIDMTLTSSQIKLDKLKMIDLPVYGIWGEKDSWVSVEDIYVLEELIPNFRYTVIEGAGHCPMETHPEQFNQILLEELLLHNP